MRIGNPVAHQTAIAKLARWLAPLLLMLALTSGARAQGGGGFLVVTPTGGENFVVDSTVQIRWLAQGVTGGLLIDYSVDSGAVWKRVDSVTAKAGLDSLAWVVPNDTSHRALVRISSADGSKTARSRRVFSITLKPIPAITVIYPNGGELFGADSTVKIRWNATNVTGTILVDYSNDSGKTWKPVGTAPARNGNDTLLWTVPHDSTTKALVRVLSSDSATKDLSNRTFTIRASVSPKVKLLAPNGGEVFRADSAAMIRWQTQDITGTLTIELSTDGGTAWTVIGSRQARAGIDSIAWKVPNDSTTMALIRISNGALRDTSDAVFTINPRIPPPPVTLHLLYPNGGEKFVEDSTLAIRWTSANDTEKLAVIFSGDGGASWRLIDSVMPKPGNDSMFWTVPKATSSNARIAIVTADGKVGDTTDATFSIIAEQGGPVDGVDIRDANLAGLRSLGAFPNPAAGETELRWRQERAGDVVVSIYDAAGSLRGTVTAGRRDAGEQRLRISTATMPAGAYLVEVRSGADRWNCGVTVAR